MLTQECQLYYEAESDTPLPKRVKPSYGDTSLLGTVVDMITDTVEEEDLQLQEDTYEITSYLQEPNLPIHTATTNPTDLNQERNSPLQYWKVNEKSKVN